MNILVLQVATVGFQNTTVAQLYFFFFTIGMPGAGMFLCFDGKIYLHMTYSNPDVNALNGMTSMQ